MKRILLVILAALLFCGCSFKLPQTGKGNKEENTESAVQQAGIKDSNGQNIPITEAVIYDRCGVRLTSPGMVDDAPRLTVTNSSDKTVKLISAYVSADGTVRSDIYISTDYIEPGSTGDVSIEGLSNVCSLKTRLMLEDESYNIVEGSLSDVIEVTLSDKLYLPAKQLYTLIYEDDKLLLGLCDVNYRDDSNRVTLKFYLRNKTDKDLWISARDVTCDHADYSATMSTVLPAGTDGSFSMRATTRNSTISAADLDSISMSIEMRSLEDHFDPKDYDTGEKTERFTVRLPKTGRPETVIPDRIESTVAPEEYISEITGSGRITPLPVMESSDLLYEDENMTAELVLTALGVSDGGSKYCSLHFRVQNKLQKQIKLAPVGIINGATFKLYSGSGIKPMTEQYIEITSAELDESIIGSFSDISMRFEYYYDDGVYDESSFIGATEPFSVRCSDTLSRPGVPEGADKLYSDENCELYLLGIEKDEDYGRLDLNVYGVNKSDKPIAVSLSSTDVTIIKTLPMFAHTYACGKFSIYSFGDELTPDSLKGISLTVQVQDLNGELLSEGEAKL